MHNPNNNACRTCLEIASYAIGSTLSISGLLFAALLPDNYSARVAGVILPITGTTMIIGSFFDRRRANQPADPARAPLLTQQSTTAVKTVSLPAAKQPSVSNPAQPLAQTSLTQGSSV
ncbi:MAG: hypothetical protein WCW01_02985 [Gammaproteobacteria bacterium]